MTTDVQAEKTIQITLSRSAPVRIKAKDWPQIASAKDWDNQYEFQANRTWSLRVRRHADGRTLVYGEFRSHFQQERDIVAGELVSLEETEAAIQRVAEELDRLHLARECISELPATEI